MNEAILTEMQNHKWVMEPTALKAFIEKISKLSSVSLITSVSVDMPKKTLQVVDGVAKIKISGVLLKSVPGWLRLWGFNITGYDEITEQIEEAVNDSKISAIELVVSSPGGMVAGVTEAADAIYNARQSKPVTAIVEDLSASGAYWLTSQAQSISAGRVAEIGSIGVYSVYYDWTGWEEKAGIKAVVIRSGEHKGMGMDTITDNQKAAVQEIIDDLAAQFVDSVAAGRNKSAETIKKLATGRLWVAEKARELGLIDTVIVKENNNNNNSGDSVMDTNENKAEQEKIEKEKAELAAQKKIAEQEKIQLEERGRLSELKKAFPDDLEFAIEQFEAGVSLIEAKAAYADVLQKKLTEKENIGADPLKSVDSTAAADGENFVSLGKKMAKEEKIPLGQAYKKLAKERPELHKAYKQSLGL
jgi:signal peptide peptidase SppA